MYLRLDQAAQLPAAQAAEEPALELGDQAGHWLDPGRERCAIYDQLLQLVIDHQSKQVGFEPAKPFIDLRQLFVELFL